MERSIDSISGAGLTSFSVAFICRCAGRLMAATTMSAALVVGLGRGAYFGDVVEAARLGDEVELDFG